VADTQLGRLWAFDVAGVGELSPGPGFAPGRVIANLPGYQLLDSMAVEATGKVCVATIINGGITAFDPDGTTEHFAFPDLICTNICFGGPDMRTAWITASATGKLFKARWPRPGLKLNFNG
jgi:gluconolactonase